MIDKPFHQIDAADVAELSKRGAYESEALEFKSNLPGDADRSNSWNAGGNISASARDGLFREIVAFANAQGGTLILGVAETKEKPARAKEITPIARVHDLAGRLLEAARACIEPPLGSLQIQGIDTQEDGKGVVIFRTASSLAGPHRLVGDGHAFIRRGPSSVKMTMREIQDLTLDLARGAERIKAIFDSRATLFTDWVRNSGSEEHGAVRLTGVPLGTFPSLPRISADPQHFPFPTSPRQRVLFDGTPMEIAGPELWLMRPVIRGIRASSHDESTRVEIFQTGLVDVWFRHGPAPDKKHFQISWILASYLRTLDLIDAVRSFVGVPDFEYALELAVDGRTIIPQVGTFPLPALLLGGFPVDPHSSWSISELPIKFPWIPYRGRNDRAEIVNAAMRDLFDATGERTPWVQLSFG